MYAPTQTVNLMWTFLLLIILPHIALGQTWTGTYKWNGTCDTSICCCGSGTMTVTSSGSSLFFTTGASWACGASTLSWSVNNPYSYTFTRTFGGQSTVYTLSGNSQTMTVSNPTLSQCTDIATKSAAVNPAAVNSASSYGYWILFGTLLVVIETINN